MTTRQPAVAGRFYSADAARLEHEVREMLTNVSAPVRHAVGAIVPHAGLMYSGQCAAIVWGQLALPPVVVILAPNHTGLLGATGGASGWMAGAFATPLGEVPVAAEFASALARGCDLVQDDPLAHEREHAIEVELPFLRLLAPDTAIVPLVLAWDDWERTEILARDLAAVTRDWDAPVLLVASSDMTHYESAASAARKDRVALAAVERLAAKELLDVCHRNHVTMCGRAPAAVVCEASRILGAGQGVVVDYRHSGHVTGDDREVVAYAGVIIR